MRLNHWRNLRKDVHTNSGYRTERTTFNFYQNLLDLARGDTNFDITNPVAAALTKCVILNSTYYSKSNLLFLALS
ncbi:hypothetical protein WG66_011870 [Moniliophthora roreri]|nr:hypothetical protein WG66_011870 [Moniliophthora roreri]